MPYNVNLRKRSVDRACLASLELTDAAGVRGSRPPHVHASHGNRPLLLLD